MKTRRSIGLLAAIGAVGWLAGGCLLEPAFKSPAVQEQAASGRSQFVHRPAPPFALADQDGREVTLQSLRGQWVVLYFYPQDDTPGCTCEATEFTTLMSSFRDLNAKVYGVSIDTVDTHKIFIQKFHLGINLLSDPTHQMMARYGAWVETHLGEQSYERVIRSTLIVDPQGVIAHHWPEVIPEGHAERVRQKLAELQARWKPD